MRSSFRVTTFIPTWISQSAQYTRKTEETFYMRSIAPWHFADAEKRKLNENQAPHKRNVHKNTFTTSKRRFIALSSRSDDADVSGKIQFSRDATVSPNCCDNYCIHDTITRSKTIRRFGQKCRQSRRPQQHEPMEECRLHTDASADSPRNNR